MEGTYVNMFNEWVVSDGDEQLETCSLAEMDAMSERLERMILHLEDKRCNLWMAMGRLAARRMREAVQDMEGSN